MDIRVISRAKSSGQNDNKVNNLDDVILHHFSVAFSYILQGIDSLKNMRRGKKKNNLNSRKGIDIDSRVLNTDPLLVEVLSGTEYSLGYRRSAKNKEQRKRNVPSLARLLSEPAIDEGTEAD